MSFNFLVLTSAIFIGCSCGAYLLWHQSNVTFLAKIRRLCLFGILLFASSLAAVFVWPALFDVLHLLYLVLTLSVPLTAAIGLVGGTLARRRLQARPTNNKATTVFLVACLLPAPLGIYATHIEPFWLRVDEVHLETTLDVEGPVRIGVLSDFQTTSVGSYEQRAIDTLLEQDLDVVMIPGDFWHLNKHDFADVQHEFADVLAQLDAAVPHVIAVSGDSDNTERLRILAAGTNVVVLDDSMTSLTVSGTDMLVLGLTVHGDETKVQAATERFLNEQAVDTDQAGQPLRVVLTHRPVKIERFTEDDNVDLFVAGHTHGGQVSLPFFGPPITASPLPKSVAAGGLHLYRGQNLYVSTGVGRERARAPQVRFGVRPSVGVIVLEPTGTSLVPSD